MKVIFDQHLNQQTLLSNIVLNGITQAVKEISNSEDYKNRGELDIVLTVNGHEIDIENFVERWQKEVEKSVLQHASEIVSNRVNEKLMDFEDMMNQFLLKIEGMLEP